MTIKKFTQNRKIIHSKIGDEVVMMDMDSGFYFGLNTIGSAIWDKLASPITAHELVDLLMMEFSVERIVCESVTHEFLNQLLERGIIKEVE